MYPSPAYVTARNADTQPLTRRYVTLLEIYPLDLVNLDTLTMQ